MSSARMVALSMLVTLAPARSQADTPEAEARRHFEEGTKAYALGEFPRAIAEYRAAYNAKPDPALLYNIAQVYRASGDLAQAAFFYRSYLRANPDAKNRIDVEKRVRDLDAQVQQQRALVTQPPTETLSTIKPPESLPGGRPPTETQPAPNGVVAPASAVATAPPPRSKPAYKKWWVWTVVGVAAAGLAVGLGVGLTANAGGPPSSHFGDTHVF